MKIIFFIIPHSPFIFTVCVSVNKFVPLNTYINIAGVKKKPRCFFSFIFLFFFHSRWPIWSESSISCKKICWKGCFGLAPVQTQCSAGNFTQGEFHYYKDTYIYIIQYYICCYCWFLTKTNTILKTTFPLNVMLIFNISWDSILKII